MSRKTGPTSLSISHRGSAFPTAPVYVNPAIDSSVIYFPSSASQRMPTVLRFQSGPVSNSTSTSTAYLQTPPFPRHSLSEAAGGDTALVNQSSNMQPQISTPPIVTQGSNYNGGSARPFQPMGGPQMYPPPNATIQHGVPARPSMGQRYVYSNIIHQPINPGLIAHQVLMQQQQTPMFSWPPVVNTDWNQHNGTPHYIPSPYTSASQYSAPANYYSAYTPTSFNHYASAPPPAPQTVPGAMIGRPQPTQTPPTHVVSTSHTYYGTGTANVSGSGQCIQPSAPMHSQSAKVNKPRSHAIPIINPNTGKQITQESKTETEVEDDSSAVTEIEKREAFEEEKIVKNLDELIIKSDSAVHSNTCALNDKVITTDENKSGSNELCVVASTQDDVDGSSLEHGGDDTTSIVTDEPIQAVHANVVVSNASATTVTLPENDITSSSTSHADQDDGWTEAIPHRSKRKKDAKNKLQVHTHKKTPTVDVFPKTEISPKKTESEIVVPRPPDLSCAVKSEIEILNDDYVVPCVSETPNIPSDKKTGEDESGHSSNIFSESSSEKLPATDTLNENSVARLQCVDVAKSDEVDTTTNVSATCLQDDGTSASDLEEAKGDCSNAASGMSALKYTYEDDQWSPINVTGKKVYSRTFLYLIKADPASSVKPDLPNFDIVLGNINTQQTDFSDFLPPFVKPTPSRGPLVRRPNNIRPLGPSGSMGMVPKQISLTLMKKVELKTSENAWKSSKSSGSENVVVDEAAEVVKKVRAILNKLTPQKFDALMVIFGEIVFDTKEKVCCAIDEIFEKALDEPSFSEIYADLSLCLKTKAIACTHSQSFVKILIAKVQKEFEKNYMDGLDEKAHAEKIAQANTPQEKKLLENEWEELERQARRRSLGNIRFIGELYKREMLTIRIIHSCIERLVSTTDEEGLECLSRLLATVGLMLEKKTKAFLENNPTFQGIYPLNHYFAKIATIISERKTSSRVRFMLQDLVELRELNWVPRRDVGGPKTIKQIHADIAMEDKMKELMNKNSMGQMGPHARRSIQPMRVAGVSSHTSTEDGWNYVPKNTGRNFQVNMDTNKKLVSGFSPSSTFSLAPQGRPGWKMGGTSNGTSDSSRSHAHMGTGSGLATSKPDSIMSKNTFDLLATSKDPVDTMTSEMQERSSAVRAVKKTFLGSGRASPMLLSSASLPAVGSAQNWQKGEMTKPNQMTLHGSNAKNSLPDNDAVLSILKKAWNSDIEDAIDHICKIYHVDTIVKFIGAAFNHAIESASLKRTKFGQLLAHLMQKKLITIGQILEFGIFPFLDHAQDWIVDIPDFWIYLSDIIAQFLVINDTSCSIISALIRDGSRRLSCASSSGRYVTALLTTLAGLIGQTEVTQRLKTASIVLEDILAPEAFVLIPKVYIVHNEEEFKSKMSLLKEKFCNNDDFSKVEFVRAAATLCVRESLRFKGGTCELDLKYLAMSEKYLKPVCEDVVSLEAEAIYAIQLLMHQLENPNRILYLIFESWFKNDIISSEGFHAWKNCSDPEQQDGKGVAIASLVQFFNCICDPPASDNDYC